jgi:hypothetical protein
MNINPIMNEDPIVATATHDNIMKLVQENPPMA